jgi:ABC-type lipoprotein release transport system permease subunit
MLSEAVTFDDWGRLMGEQSNQLVSSVYFISFVLVGTMIILVLFVGVVMEGFESGAQGRRRPAHANTRT